MGERGGENDETILRFIDATIIENEFLNVVPDFTAIIQISQVGFRETHIRNSSTTHLGL